MKRNAAILCAALLAVMSVIAFVFIFSAGGPALPGTGIMDDIPASTGAHKEENPAKPAPKEEPAVPLGTHPMDGVLQTMTLEEQVAQMFWVRCPDQGAKDLIQKYCPAGYVLFGRDFETRRGTRLRRQYSPIKTKQIFHC